MTGAITMKEKVEAIINELKPALQADGGSIELVSIDEKTGTVKVKLTGHCGTCPHAMATLKGYVEANMKNAIPEVKEVVLA